MTDITPEEARDWKRDTRRAHWLSEALALVLCAWGVVIVLAWIGGWL